MTTAQQGLREPGHMSGSSFDVLLEKLPALNCESAWDFKVLWALACSGVGDADGLTGCRSIENSGWKGHREFV